MATAVDSAAQATTVLPLEGFRFPARRLSTLTGFRSWVQSGAFPDCGRIDWIEGEVEVDMSPEDVFTHGTLKGGIAGDLRAIVEFGRKGIVLIDSSRYSAPEAALSVEPDVMVILRESLRSGRVRLVPKAGGGKGRYVEVTGAPDLVIECVSDASEAKDRSRLPGPYYRAGVRELWIVDARRRRIDFCAYRRGPRGWKRIAVDGRGFVRSPFLETRVRLVRVPIGSGMVTYRLEQAPGPTP